MDERILARWPDEVAAYYQDLAARRRWSSLTARAFAVSVEYHRRLAEGPGDRAYWHGLDPDGARWFFETVRDPGGGLVPTRQLLVEADGSRARYSWSRLEDDAGALAEGPIDDWIDRLEQVSSDRFEGEWAAE